MNNFVPSRLSWLRAQSAMSKANLAKAIGTDVRAIQAFEAGEYEPRPEKLKQLAALFSVSEQFFSGSEFDLLSVDQVSFRSLSRLSAKKRNLALSNASVAFAFNIWLESEFSLPDVDLPDFSDTVDPEAAAIALRSRWNLGDRPAPNLIHLLESKGVRFYCLSVDSMDVDAFCTWKDGTPFIFLNLGKSNARRRFDVAHELGHLVLHRKRNLSGTEVERQADEFASSFLLPRDGVNSTAPVSVNLTTLMREKSRWGVSLAAYLVRIHRLGRVSDWHYRTLFKTISMRGYRKSEPNDLPPETSQIHQKLASLTENGYSLSAVAQKLRVEVRHLYPLFFNSVSGSTDRTNNDGRKKVGNSNLHLAVDNTKET